jgi:hypothetical protein
LALPVAWCWLLRIYVQQRDRAAMEEDADASRSPVYHTHACIQADIYNRPNLSGWGSQGGRGGEGVQPAGGASPARLQIKKKNLAGPGPAGY